MDHALGLALGRREGGQSGRLEDRGRGHAGWCRSSCLDGGTLGRFGLLRVAGLGRPRGTSTHRCRWVPRAGPSPKRLGPRLGAEPLARGGADRLAGLLPLRRAGRVRLRWRPGPGLAGGGVARQGGAGGWGRGPGLDAGDDLGPAEFSPGSPRGELLDALVAGGPRGGCVGGAHLRGVVGWVGCIWGGRSVARACCSRRGQPSSAFCCSLGWGISPQAGGPPPGRPA